jgi:hypothetical protein
MGDDIRHAAKPTRRLLRRAVPFVVLAAVLLVGLACSAVRSQQPPILPDPKLTPGATLPVTKDDICVPGYTKKVRDFPKAVKDQRFIAATKVNRARDRLKDPPGHSR